MHSLTREGYPLHALPFGITLNHDVGASSLALLAAPYTYYWHAAFNLSRLHPSGGAIAGGTRLTLYLTDPTLLVDLGGEAHGIFCRFSFSQRSPTTAAALRTEVVVPGALVECGYSIDTRLRSADGGPSWSPPSSRSRAAFCSSRVNGDRGLGVLTRSSTPRRSLMPRVTGPGTVYASAARRDARASDMDVEESVRGAGD